MAVYLDSLPSGTEGDLEAIDYQIDLIRRLERRVGRVVRHVLCAYRDSWISPSHSIVLKLGFKIKSSVTLKCVTIIFSDLGERLQQMAGFRNLLVHGYTEIVAAKVHQNLSHLPDIREYVRAVCEYLDQQES